MLEMAARPLSERLTYLLRSLALREPDAPCHLGIGQITILTNLQCAKANLTTLTLGSCHKYGIVHVPAALTIRCVGGELMPTTTPLSRNPVFWQCGFF